eukprot:scaffold115_cov304-Prasinococcus_capsulatus_cf.AAC.19
MPGPSNADPLLITCLTWGAACGRQPQPRCIEYVQQTDTRSGAGKRRGRPSTGQGTIEGYEYSCPSVTFPRSTSTSHPTFQVAPLSNETASLRQYGGIVLRFKHRYKYSSRVPDLP